MSDRFDELYERACAMDPEARAAFLAEACGGDSSLERELSSLLAHQEQAEVFFATLASAIVPPAVGHRVGHYRLIGILGTGGMGTVYRAHDTRLDREVALKFLPMYRNSQHDARERFLVEARAAAALEHPNVCSIHEIGETADGWPFIAMACYEGETLSERVARGRLPPAEAVDIAVQVARGLRAAHARGIVHRDVKPGNIMLCADGTVRLLDFGLAKTADLSLTDPGTTPGTVAYMSPEHTRGDPVGPTTDLWSLGVVLYEMLAGVRPFRGGSEHAVVHAILHEQPERLQSRVRDGPPLLGRVVERLLRKTPAERYRSADELLGDLVRAAPADGMEAVRGWVQAHRRAVALSGASVVVMATLLAVAARRSEVIATPPDPPSPPPAIAVLPFTVHGAGLEVWREGMVDLLSMGLDGVAGIRAVDSRTLLARWHQEVGEASATGLAIALDIARRTEARYALVGSAVTAGSLIRLRADVYDVESGQVVGPVQVEGPPDSMLALVDRLGIQTLGLLLEKDPGEIPALDLSSITTTSLIALKHYLEAQGHYRRAEFRGASAAWERAVRADSLFALAYYRLAESYAWHDVGGQRFRENLERAAHLADRLPGLEGMLLRARRMETTGGGGVAAIVRDAIAKYPDAAAAWYVLGEVYHHDAAAMGTPGAAEAAFRRAAELQPAMAPYAVHLLELTFRWHPDSALIARELEAYGRLASGDDWARAGRIAHALSFGDSAARAQARADLPTLDRQSAINVYLFLAHPRFAEVREAAYPVIDTRLDPGSRARLRHPRVLNLGLMDGRARYALRILNEPPAGDGVWYCGPLYLSDRGLPVPDRILDQRLAASRADDALFSSPQPVMCAAQLAAWKGEWSEHSALLARARTVAARNLAAGDSLSAREWDLIVLSGEAHGLWRRGRTEEALDAFQRALAIEGWRSLWHVGQLALELGRLDEAERAFRALLKRDGTPAYLQLARILERTGRVAEAREAYEFVAYAWRNADPELQPAVADARLSIARLSRAGD